VLSSFADYLGRGLSLQTHSVGVTLMEEEEFRRLATDYAAAWCSQDPLRVASFYEESASLTINGEPPARGRAAIATEARSFMTAFPDMRVLFDDLEFTDNDIRFHWTLTGTNTGSGGTGRAICISGYESWQMGENGLIANSQGHFDNEDYQRQLNS